MFRNEIKLKWKTFAAEQLLTEWDPNLSAEQVFDLIVDSPDEDLEDNIDDHAVLIWAPFMVMDLTDFSCHLERLARHAQETEEI